MNSGKAIIPWSRIVSFQNPQGVWCWANAAAVAIIWLMKKLKLPPLVELDDGEDTGKFLKIFMNWYRSTGEKSVSPFDGLMALLKQHTTYNDLQISKFESG